VHKLIVLYPAPEDPAAFEDYYRNTHLPLAKKLPGTLAQRFTLSVDAAEGESPYFAIFEADFIDKAAMIAAGRSIASSVRERIHSGRQATGDPIPDAKHPPGVGSPMWRTGQTARSVSPRYRTRRGEPLVVVAPQGYRTGTGATAEKTSAVRVDVSEVSGRAAKRRARIAGLRRTDRVPTDLIMNSQIKHRQIDLMGVSAREQEIAHQMIERELKRQEKRLLKARAKQSIAR